MTSHKNVGWVRPEAVTHQDEKQGWRDATLGEFVATKTKGIVPNKTPGTTFELYSVPSLDTGSPEIVRGGEIGSNKQIVDEGTVLLCKINPRINRSWVVSSHTAHQKIASTEWITFPSNEAFEPKYLAYYLKQDTVRDFLAANASGVGGSLMRVKPATLKDYVFPLAPLDQQKRIVAEIEKQFSRLDEAVANLKRVKANLKRYKATVLKAAVEGRLVETEAELARREGRSFETGEQLLQRILETRRSQWKGKGKYKEPAAPDTTDLPELPEGWVWATTDQLGRIQLGRQRSPKNRSKNFPVKYIRAANITVRGLELEDVLDMEFSPDEQDRYRLRRGDLVLSEASGSPDQVGKPAVWQDQLPLCCFQNTVIRLRPTIEMSPYLLTCFQTYYVNGVFAKVAGGVGINHLSADKFSRVHVSLPPLAEQYRIVAEVDRRLSLVREVETQVDANLQRAERLRQAVLARAFTGESGYALLTRPTRLGFL